MTVFKVFSPSIEKWDSLWQNGECLLFVEKDDVPVWKPTLAKVLAFLAFAFYSLSLILSLIFSLCFFKRRTIMNTVLSTYRAFTLDHNQKMQDCL